MRRGIVLLLLAATVAAVVALPVVAATPKVAGTVGPGFTIAIAKKPTKAGKYTFLCDPHASTMRGTFRIR